MPNPIDTEPLPPPVVLSDPPTVKEAAQLIRYWAKLNYNNKSMAFHQFMGLADKLDPSVKK